MLFRLLKKDLLLVDRLKFELVDEATVEERRQAMEDTIIAEVEGMTKRFYSPGYLMMDMRYLSGEITAHVKTTKDPFGEVYLNLLMLVEILKGNNQHIQQTGLAKSHKLSIYIMARAFKILVLINKLHADLFLEFEKNLKELGRLIGDNPILMHTAIHHGLDVNWLISGDIPEDIDNIQKDLRKRGFLK